MCHFPMKTVFTISPGPTRKFLRRAEVDQYIDSLSRKQKDQVRFLSGHGVYYGIHEHFQRKPRYFTFLRDPIDRTFSNYNFMMQDYDIVEKESGRFPQNKDELTFEQWWNNVPRNMQTGVVLNYRVDDKPGWDPELRLSESHLEEAKRILDDFYFVGLTETFEEDSLFLYNEMNVSRFLKKKQNVTKKKYAELNEQFIETIRPGIALDMGLYEHARNLNREFKRSRPDFAQIVERVRAEGKYHTPIGSVVMDAVQSLIGWRRLHLLTERKPKIVETIIKLVR